MAERRTIRWAERVRPGKMRRLYHLSKRGIYDVGLLDEVGWGLHARCGDALVVNRAMRGEVPCPECGEIVPRPSRPAAQPARGGYAPEQFACPECGRSITWRECRDALRNRPMCFDCLRVLHWRYADNHLSCSHCGREWTWQQYLQSVRGRVLLPCSRCRV